MKFIELVKGRKSLRKYLPNPVSREMLDKCFEAARFAPSACNTQPWFFIAVDDVNLKNKLAEGAFSGIYSINKFAANAPVLVVVIRKYSNPAVSAAGFLRDIQYSLIDIGMACEHFALSAQEQGLGTCFLGWFDQRRVKKILNIPKREKVDIIISVGYPENIGAADKARKSLSQTRIYRRPI